LKIIFAAAKGQKTPQRVKFNAEIQLIKSHKAQSCYCYYIFSILSVAQAEPCGCWNTTEDGREVEVECKCGGPRLTLIPADLPHGVQRM
jgi:hypothetical protein